MNGYPNAIDEVQMLESSTGAGAAGGPDPRRTAIALSYDKSGTGAPKVVAKGYGLIADSIIDRARAEGLYVHDAPEMVAMLANVALDREIPAALYQAVAELLGWLYGLESRAGAPPPKRGSYPGSGN